MPTADMYLVAAELHKRKHSVKVKIKKTNKQKAPKYSTIILHKKIKGRKPTID